MLVPKKTENPIPKRENGLVRIPEELKPDPGRDFGKIAVIYSDKKSSSDPAQTLWELYASGYKLAGNSLIEENAGEFFFNVSIYPIIFLYRHYIELRLKQISIYGNEYFDNPNTTDKKRNDILFREHKLTALWKLSVEVIERLFPEEQGKKLSSMKKLLDRFIEMDNTSFLFRYPIDKYANPNHSMNKRNFISVIRLKEIVNELGAYLDGIAHCIYDMPGHGVFLPEQRKINEEQRKILISIIDSAERDLTYDEISKLINEKFGLYYSPEQLSCHPEIFVLSDDDSIE
jgi:hypothetical protein